MELKMRGISVVVLAIVLASAPAVMHLQAWR
jgi:hypothetical protein